MGSSLPDSAAHRDPLPFIRRTDMGRRIEPFSVDLGPGWWRGGTYHPSGGDIRPEPRPCHRIVIRDSYTSLMFLFRRDSSMPSPTDAIPGRSEPIPVPERHVNGERIVAPFPDGTKTAVLPSSKDRSSASRTASC